MNKPVAWMDEDENVIFEKNWAYPIPLYTHPAPTKVKFASDSCESGWIYLENVHPVKELTDEEIEECYWGDGYPDNPRHPKEFARAILKKAQEK